jgi:hypothetical protein
LRVERGEKIFPRPQPIFLSFGAEAIRERAVIERGVWIYRKFPVARERTE